MKFAHRVSVRKKFDFLCAALEQFDSATVALEGDLSQCIFQDAIVESREPNDILQRNTLQPLQDFVILKLRPTTRGEVIRQIKQAGLKRGIIHVEIEANGEVQLGAYDQMSKQTVVTGRLLGPNILEQWKQAKLIWGYELVEVAQ